MQEVPRTIFAGWHVVVVDDEEDSLDIVQILLEAYGATVTLAPNGLEAFALVQRIKPHFIISDISMPEGDGWEFIKALHKDESLCHIPVIALTAHAMTGDRERVMQAGFDHYLTKPIIPETFANQLAALLNDTLPGKDLPFSS